MFMSKNKKRKPQATYRKDEPVDDLLAEIQSKPFLIVLIINIVVLLFLSYEFYGRF